MTKLELIKTVQAQIQTLDIEARKLSLTPHSTSEQISAVAVKLERLQARLELLTFS